MSSTEMKSYLSLIPISAKVRRRQNRMTILCIVLAVFLVTAVFSMADMAIRMETSNQLNKNGNWHIMVKDISPETAAELAAQEDVAAFSAYSDINASLTENYFAGDKRAALVGADDAILQIFPGMQCSTAPADGEVLVTANIRDWLDVTVGTAIPLTLPDGQTISLTVAGFNEDTSDANQYDAVVLVMNRSTFSQIAAQVEESFETQYFIQFKPRTNLRQSIVNIENKYGISEEKISENTYLMALNASSNNDYIVGLYAVAAVLAGMVVLAGIFMITGSINSNVAQRTSYYGMLRCLGAGKNQVRMLVRLEALFWCKTAVPAGCVLGIVSTWGLCSFLRGFIGEEFSSLPVLGISPVLGMELGGSLKNVIALAAGMADGLGYGDNTKAALITRGMFEMNKLAVTMGAKQETLNGLTGIGDLIVTCASKHSRNRKAGVLIGEGMTMEEAMAEVKMVVEGVYSAKAARELAEKYEVSMPIVEKVNQVLFEGKPAKDAVSELMMRDGRSEYSNLPWD